MDYTVVTRFPRPVAEVENVFIPLADGTRLAARLWLPEDAEADPVPAILEYLPYRKRDGTAERDATTHPYLAGHGYACLRVDMRGTGDSEGVCRGEYLAQEQDDALEVLDWIAAQPWSSGRAGMIGISWGGFNGLQVAARQHPVLQAVVSICSTDDRYADDIHMIGGAMLTDKATWGATAFTIAMTPPDPAIVGDRWRDLWRERLENNGCWAIEWFRHQRRDAFYAHGSVCEDWSAMTTPVLAVGGWADGYTNAVFRLVEHMGGKCRGIIGPWAHKYPHFARPGPRIGFLQECLRWFDQHLKGRDTGVMEESPIRAFIEDPGAPSPAHPDLSGRWVAVDWPGAPETLRLALAPHRLVPEGTGSDGMLTIASPQTVGLAASSFFNYGLVADGALDQREEAGGSLVFDSDPLGEDVELFGFPVLEASITSDQPVATLAAVLSGVAPDGRVTRVTFGILNLTHRAGHAEPEPLTPGQPCRIRLTLNACGRRFKKGSRIRLALSTAYWPLIFPPPRPVRLSVDLGGATFTLPVLQEKPGAPAFGPAEGSAPLEKTVLREGNYRRVLTRDLVTGVWDYERADDQGRVRHEHTGLVIEQRNSDRFRIQTDDPTSASVTCDWVKAYARGDWQARVATHLSVEALETVWRIRARVEAHEGESLFHEQEWAEDVPRDLV